MVNLSVSKAVVIVDKDDAGREIGRINRPVRPGGTWSAEGQRFGMAEATTRGQLLIKVSQLIEIREKPKSLGPIAQKYKLRPSELVAPGMKRDAAKSASWEKIKAQTRARSLKHQQTAATIWSHVKEEE